MTLPDTLISPDRKAALQAHYEALNPAALWRDLLHLQNRLWDTAPVGQDVPKKASML